MKFGRVVLAAAAASVMIAAPAQAGWRLIENSQPVAVGKGELTVTPQQDWNRNTSRPVKGSEQWTLDGVTLNELYFVSGLRSGKTLFKDRDKKNNPLPRLQENILLTDIPEFVESSMRVQMGTSLFEVDEIEPTTFLGQPGVKWRFHFGVQADALIRRGVAVGTMVDGELYLITFVAPELHYFERDLEEAEAIMSSATLG